MADQNFRVKRGLEVGIGATVLSATSGGNVGVGTTNPTTNLDVNGGVRIRGALYDKDNQVGNPNQVLSSTGSGIDWVNAAPSNAITGLTIRDEGNVVGSANNVSELNFVGSIVSVASTLGIATITVSNTLSDNLVGTALSISGIATASTLVASKVAYSDGITSSNSTFGNGWVLGAPASTTYYKIATLPASSAGTFDHLTIEGVMGGWTNDTTTPFKILFSNRNGFDYKYESYGTLRTDARIIGISTNSTTEIWAQHSAGGYTKLLYSITNSVQVAVVANPTSTTTAPVGTTVFDSSTYVPRFIINESDNVGINSTTPTSKLDIVGDAKISGITTSARLTLNGANDTTTGGGQIYLNGATGNRIDFNTNGVAAPTFTTRSAGTKLVLYPSVSASAVDYAFGIQSGTLWYSIPEFVSAYQFRWYGGQTQLADLKGTGEFLLGSTSIVSSAKLQVTGGAYVSGSVGIGTTNPQDTLDVGVGTIRLYNKSVPSRFSQIYQDGALTFKNSAVGDDFQFLASSNSLMVLKGSGPLILPGTASLTGTASQLLQVTGGAYISGVGVATGSIGVGITNPQGAIDIRTSPQWSSFNWGANLIIGGSRNNALGILDSTNSNPWAIGNGAGTLLITPMPSLGDTTTGLTYALQITRSGNLIVGSGSSTGTASQTLQVTGGAYVSGNTGIGITNPISELEVNGDIGFEYGSSIFASRWNAPTSEGGNNSWVNGTSKLINVAWNGSHDTVTLFTPGSVSSSPKLTILSNNNIGVSTNNPSDRLHVLGGNIRVDSSTGAINFWSGGGWYGGFGLAAGLGGAGIDMAIRTEPNRSLIFYTGGANDRGRIDSSGTFIVGSATSTGTANQRLQVTGGAYVSGNVGINTTAPGSTLAVGGTITELFNGTYWNVVTQADVGYGASQVPLNQYLGQLAFLDDFSPNGLRRDGGGSDDVSVDSNGNVSIVGSITVAGVSTFQNNVFLGDNDSLYFGDGNDLRIWHNGTHSNIADVGTGDLYLGGNNNVVIADGALSETKAKFITNGSVELYYDNSKKFETTGAGITVFGTTETQQLVVSGVSTFQGNVNLGDNDILYFGDGNDLAIYHTGTNSFISDAGTGNLGILGDNEVWIGNTAATEYKARFFTNGAVELYYDNSKKFETTGYGVTVSGGLYASGISTFANGNTTYGTGSTSSLELGLNNNSNVGTLKLWGSTTNAYGLIQATTSNLHIDTVVGGTYLNYYDGDFISFGTGASAESARFTGNTGTLTLGTITPTGTASQPLQVTGGAYVSGNLGVGNTNGEGIKLFVSQGAPAANRPVALITDDGTIPTMTGGATLRISNDGSINSFALLEAESSVGRLVFTNAGNLGIGTTNPLAKFHVSTGTLPNALGALPTGTRIISDADSGSNYFTFRNASNNTTYAGLLFQDDNIGGYIVQRNAGDSNIDFDSMLYGAVRDHVFKTTNIGISGAGTEVLRIKQSGDVGIGTTNPQYKLHVIGSFAATTKSFVIDHPTKEGMKLRYGSLEGPENGVYVRGRLKGNNTIELPEYWTGLVDEDSITVNITPIGRKAPLHSVVDIVDNTVVVESANDVVDCFYTVFAERKDVAKLEVEF